MKHKISEKEKSYYDWLKRELIELTRVHMDGIKHDIEVMFDSPLMLEEVLQLRVKMEEEIEAVVKDLSAKRYSRTPKHKREEYRWEEKHE